VYSNISFKIEKLSRNNQQRVYHCKSRENRSNSLRYGGNIVVCHPGIASSKVKDTIIVYQEITRSGVANYARTKETAEIVASL
jgi:hypothetical protein